MKLQNVLLFLLLLPAFMYAQGPVFQKVQKAHTKSVGPDYSIVSKSSATLKSVDIDESILDKGVLLDLDLTAIGNLKNAKNETLNLNFPLTENKFRFF